MPCKSKKSRFLTSLNSNSIYVRSNESDPLCKNTSGICGEPGSQSNPVLYDEVEDIIKTMTPSASPIVLNFIGSGTFGTEGKIYTYISSIVFNGISQETTNIHGEHVFTLENNMTGSRSISQQQVIIEALSVKYENRLTIDFPLAIVPLFPSIKFEAHDTRFNNGLSINASGGALNMKLINCFIEVKEGQVIDVGAAGDSVVNLYLNNTNLSNAGVAGADTLIIANATDEATLNWNVDGGGFSLTTGAGIPAIAVNVSENGKYTEKIMNQTNNVTLVEPEVVPLTDDIPAVEIWKVADNGSIDSVKSNIYSKLYSDVLNYCWLKVDREVVIALGRGIKATVSNSIIDGCYNFVYSAAGDTTTFSNTELNGSFSQTGGNFTASSLVLNGDASFTGSGYSLNGCKVNGSVYQNGGNGVIEASAIEVEELPVDPVIPESAAAVTVDTAGTLRLSGSSVLYGGCGPASILFKNGGNGVISGSEMILEQCGAVVPVYIGGDGSDGTAVSVSGSRFTGNSSGPTISDVETVMYSASNYFGKGVSNTIRAATNVVKSPNDLVAEVV